MITHKGTQTLRTPRLTLRRFTPDDAQAMFENWASDARVTRYLTWQPHISPEATAQLLKDWCATYENPSTYNWVLEYAGVPIGSIGAAHLSERDESAELGYCMGYAYWGKGLMTEAVRAVIDYLFAEVGLNRVTILHAAGNPASGKVARKCGLTYEGTHREAFQSASGEFHDLLQYAILRREWAAGSSRA